MKEDSKLVIAGGEGFIGKNLMRYFSKVHPISLDRQGTADYVCNLQETWPFVPFAHRVICCASEPNIWGNPNPPDVEHEVRIVREAVRFCLRTKAKALVHLSSSNVYGGGCNNPPFSEDMELNPTHAYGKQKVLAELELRRLSALHPELSITCIRLFNAIGLHQRKTMFPYLIVDSIVKDEPLPLYGIRHRAWTPVRDICAFVGATLNFNSKPGFKVLNFGARKLYTQQSLIRLFEERLALVGFETPLRVVLEAPRPEEMEVSYPDLSLHGGGRLPNSPFTFAIDDVIETVCADHKIVIDTDRD